MIKRLAVVILAAAVLLGGFQAAQAALNSVGPTSAATGHYPVWYQDANGLQLELCLSTAVNPANGLPLCVLPGLVPPLPFNPALPIVFPLNFPDESFYFLAEATITDAATTVDLRYTAALEAAFANGDVIDGDQISFSRIRIRMSLTVEHPGHYIITHPYGVEEFNVTGTGRVINFTRDIGIGAPGDFTGALGGDVGPFLTAANRITGSTGEIFIGDPNVTQTVTGSPKGTNFLRVQAPGVINDLQTDQFTLAGKMFGGVLPADVSVPRSTYSRSAASGQIDVFATSTTPGATLSFRDALVGGTTTPMATDNAGHFFGSEPLTTPTGNIPDFVIVTATALGATPSPLGSRVIDVVKITRAVYTLDTRTLLIEAASSDTFDPPLLVSERFGALTLVGAGPSQQLAVPDVPQPPARVTVTSSYGGSDTEPVLVVPTVPNRIATTTTISAPPVTFQANGLVTVTVTAATGTPTGTVALRVDGGPALTLSLTGGSATFSLTQPAVGSHALSASYAPQDIFAFAASSAAGILVVNAGNQPPVAVNDSATTPPGVAVNINVLGNDSDPDGNLPLTVANLTLPGSAGQVGSVALQSNNTVTYTPPNNPNVTSVTFTYQARDSLGALSNLPAAKVTVTITATPPPPPGAIATTTGLTSSLNPSPSNGNQAGRTIVFTATVLQASGATVPTGTVTFREGTTILGTGTLNAGKATLTMTGAANTNVRNGTLGRGTHPITAVYGGSATFSGSTSAVLTQVVN